MGSFPYLSIWLLVPALALAITLEVPSGNGKITSPYQYGLIYEDISHSGDGGLYAELIQNRAFQAAGFDSASTDPFTATGDSEISLSNTVTPLSSALPWSMLVSGSGDSAGFSNPGYWGIEVKPQEYTGTFWTLGDYSGDFTASFVSTTSQKTLASTIIPSQSTAGTWAQHNFTLQPTESATDVNNTFVLSFETAKATNQSLAFNFISVFPPTYNDRANGLRIDLVDAVAGVTPSFMRLPGGNNLEGNSVGQQLKWNETIGPLIDRPGHPGAWGYYDTDGFGLAELLNWCLDLKMEPVFAIFAAHWLDGTTVAEGDIQPYVDDVLNELEYIMGSTDTKYGALRASHGYPDGWKINFVEVGNEDNLSDGLASYQSYRFKAFNDAIKNAYPDITVIASTTDIAAPDNSLIDFHEYTTPDTFVSQFRMFDNGNTSVRTLVGEYATLAPNGAEANVYGPERASYPFWVGSIGEAVFLLGLERNAQTIFGAAYAPILQNINSYQWTPDLISYTADSSQTFRSTSWRMLELLSGTRIATIQNDTAAGDDTFGPAYWASGTTSSGGGVVKAAIYNATSDVPFSVSFEGVQTTTANLTVLTAPDPYSSVRIGDDPVVANSTLITAVDGAFIFSLPNYSVAILATE